MGLLDVLRRPYGERVERDAAGRALLALVRGEETGHELGVRYVSEGDSWWVEVPDELPRVRPEARDVAHGLLRHAAFATSLRDWARLVICLTDLDPIDEPPDGDRIVDALWAAAECEGVSEANLLLARRLAGGDANGALA
jgi:hypothetical protein